jgi:hypothetical protein
MARLNQNLIVFSVILGLSTFCIGQNVTATAATPLKWYRGNTHTHTINSDGDSSPEAVVRWYSENGYNFVFITDHEFITPADPLNKLFGKAGEFLVIQGQEITDRLDGKPFHVNALGIGSVIMPQRGKSVVENLQRNIELVHAAGGVPQINHPNFGWALTSNDIRQVKNIALIEIYNGHPLVNNFGGGGSPSAEEIWDLLLSAGKLIYGIGSDDSHYFKRLGDRSAPTPGQAWVVVRAPELSQAAILQALERGDFYASTGVELENYSTDARSITINIRQEKSSKYTVYFIGRGGRTLRTVINNPAVYKFRGNEGYVRAKIVESNGRLAWTQPVQVKRK